MNDPDMFFACPDSSTPERKGAKKLRETRSSRKGEGRIINGGGWELQIDDHKQLSIEI